MDDSGFQVSNACNEIHDTYISITREWVKSQIVELAYRTIVLLIGFLITYLGYLLFLTGVAGSGALELPMSQYQWTFENATPGICLTLLGVFIVMSGIWRLMPMPTLDKPTISQFVETYSMGKQSAEVGEVISKKTAPTVEKITSVEKIKRKTPTEKNSLATKAPSVEKTSTVRKSTKAKPDIESELVKEG